MPALNKRNLKRYEGCRQSRFDETEGSALQPLPVQPFEYGVWLPAPSVPGDYHIYVYHHAYSVPYTLAGSKVEVKVSHQKVEIFHQHHRVAIHPRSHRNLLTRTKLLILDDWAMSTLSDMGRQDLLDIIEERTGEGAMVITSQLPVTQWHVYIDEPTTADAIMDRLIHRSPRLELSGESMRKKQSLNLAKQE